MENQQIALVTGAGSGIGKNCAIALSKSGFALVLAGRRQETLAETAAEIGSGNTLVVPTDVSDPESVNRLFAQIQERFGRIDVLFNNAGINVAAVPMDELDIADWKKVVDINLTGVFLCTQAAFRMMKKQTPMGGRIINNGSLSAHIPRPNSAPYTATKHAVSGLTKCTALDGRPFDIACSQIDIGNAATFMTDRMSTGVLQANGTMAEEPTMRVADVARAVVYIASLPLDTNVPSMMVMATQMPFVGRG